jgi:hypothetical protein
VVAKPWQGNRDKAAERNMKVYLLMLLIGAILTAIRFTSASDRKSEPVQQ